MKRISFSLLIVSVLILCGCEGFLKEENRANNTANDYYGTAEGYNALINYSYSFLREMYGNNPPRLFCAGTDLYMLDYGSDYQNRGGVANYVNLRADDSDVETFYNLCWSAIGAANTALFYAEKTEQTNDLNRQIAEVRFLRAHFYFLLVQQFGGVALIREMTTSPVREIPRASAQEIYNFVITEFSDLLNSELPAGGVVATGNNGRIDKRVVRYYLAMAYLSRGYESFRSSSEAQSDFTQAKNLAVTAIENQDFTLTYEQAYGPTTYRNNEIIFSIPYALANTPLGVNGNIKMSLFCGSFGGTSENHKAVSKGDTYAGTLFSHYVFSKDIGDPNNDVRHEMTFMRVIYNSYMDFYSKSAADLEGTKIFRLYVPWWLDADMDAWVANWRAGGTPGQNRINTIVKVYPDPGDPDMDLANFQWWSGAQSNPTENKYGWAALNTAIYNYPLCRKFDDPNPPEFGGHCSRRDLDLVRLSDLYFLAAEASIQLNSGDAHLYINPIRARSIAASDVRQKITSTQATIDFLLDEKARESHGDFNRWMDLKRTGKLIERTVKYNPDVLFTANSFKGSDGSNKILRPIPQSAIDINQAEIMQNPGY